MSEEEVKQKISESIQMGETLMKLPGLTNHNLNIRLCTIYDEDESFIMEARYILEENKFVFTVSLKYMPDMEVPEGSTAVTVTFNDGDSYDEQLDEAVEYIMLAQDAFNCHINWLGD